MTERSASAGGRTFIIPFPLSHVCSRLPSGATSWPCRPPRPRAPSHNPGLSVTKASGSRMPVRRRVGEAQKRPLTAKNSVVPPNTTQALARRLRRSTHRDIHLQHARREVAAPFKTYNHKIKISARGTCRTQIIQPRCAHRLTRFLQLTNKEVAIPSGRAFTK